MITFRFLYCSNVSIFIIYLFSPSQCRPPNSDKILKVMLVVALQKKKIHKAGYTKRSLCRSRCYSQARHTDSAGKTQQNDPRVHPQPSSYQHKNIINGKWKSSEETTSKIDKQIHKMQTIIYNIQTLLATIWPMGTEKTWHTLSTRGNLFSGRHREIYCARHVWKTNSSPGSRVSPLLSQHNSGRRSVDLREPWVLSPNTKQVISGTVLVHTRTFGV